MIARTREVDASAIRLSRRLRTLYRCNREFFQAQNEQELLQSVCQILVAGDDLCLAWIGYSENDPEKTLRPVARAKLTGSMASRAIRTILPGDPRRLHEDLIRALRFH